MSMPSRDGAPEPHRRAPGGGQWRTSARSACSSGRIVLRGNRATKVDANGLEAFDSPRFPPLASSRRASWSTRESPRPSRSPRMRTCGSRTSRRCVSSRASRAASSTTCASPPLQGLVIEAYGARQRTRGRPALLAAIETATAAGVVIVVVTQCLHGAVQPGAYATGSALLDAGAVPGFDLTTRSRADQARVLLGEGCLPRRSALRSRRSRRRADQRGRATAPTTCSTK